LLLLWAIIRFGAATCCSDLFWALICACALSASSRAAVAGPGAGVGAGVASGAAAGCVDVDVFVDVFVCAAATRGCWVILGVALVAPFVFVAAKVLVMAVDADADGIACTPCFDCRGCTPIERACTIAGLAWARALANTAFACRANAPGSAESGGVADGGAVADVGGGAAAAATSGPVFAVVVAVAFAFAFAVTFVVTFAMRSKDLRMCRKGCCSCCRFCCDCGCGCG